MNIIYSICDYRYIILRSVRSQASGRRFTFFFTNYLPIFQLSDIILLKMLPGTPYQKEGRAPEFFISYFKQFFRRAVLQQIFCI